MAKASFTMPEDFLLKVSKLEKNTDTIIPKVLAAGAKEVETEVKNQLTSVIGKNIKSEKSQSTGQLVAALGTTPALQDSDGNFNVKIGFAENRKDGKRNAMIAGVIEYGKSGQSPKPFLKPAKKASEKACINAMMKKLDEEITKI